MERTCNSLFYHCLTLLGANKKKSKLTVVVKIEIGVCRKPLQSFEMTVRTSQVELL